MNYSNEMKWHEKLLSELATPEGVDELILSLLGVQGNSLRNYSRLFNIRDEVEIPENDLSHFSIESLLEAPELLLNTSNTVAEDVWKVENNMISLSNHTEYSEQLIKAVDCICPHKTMPVNDTVPVTILIPDSNILKSSRLDGKKTSWRFIKINEEDCEDKVGLERAVEEEGYLLGLRLFLIFKILGLTSSQQPSKNLSSTFPKLLKELKLNEQFKFISTKKLREKRSLIRKENELYLKVKKKKRLLERLDEKIKKIKSDLLSDDSKLELLIENKGNLLNELKSLTEKERSLAREYVGLNIYHSSNAPKKGFYYSIPRFVLNEANIFSYDDDVDSDKQIVPTLSINLEMPKYKASSFENEPSDFRHMRLMLSYFFPMTTGTAITFNIRKGTYKTPQLILPERWNELVMAMKDHNSTKPSSKTEEAMTEGNFRGICMAALHEGLHHENREFMRLLPYVPNTSADDVMKY